VRQPRLRSTREAHFHFNSNCNQIVERDRPNDFQTFGADFVQACPLQYATVENRNRSGRSPNPDLVKRSVIVGHSAIEIGKISTLAERIGGGKMLRVRSAGESDGSVTSSDLSPIISKRIPPRTDLLFTNRAALAQNGGYVEAIGGGKFSNASSPSKNQKLDLCGKGRAPMPGPGPFQ